MKHRNKLLPTIFSKYYVNTSKVCFPIGGFVSMSSINKLMTKFCVIWTKFIKLYTQRPAVTSQNDISKLQKQLRSALQSHFDQSANFVSFTHKCIHDSKPQGCDQQHKSLKVTWNATNRCKHKNEASKRSFANNLFKISCKYTQGMLSNWKLCSV